ncbi:uncharacterized protein TEOVI_000389900 [Trypanosoma equiperdum]|uniref:Uncharacterized protein n=2 Tax=Trypanozoon TaxID=39700 RepID=Q38ES9_TRYB2|nr:hypothetical protein Tb09.160.4760 [Trypanosoma brucei brucei TREU927]EAN76691.1 hypothetical protein Tb09.160.4760 [Trypanosoma brucei brucei TREU927]SCU72323.1 hypothetical protein, conserved [Trypanosoma equiperdum]
MGNAQDIPNSFRRTVVSLHYRESPFSGDDDEVSQLCRTIFCTRLTADEFACYWTAEDVRQLRLYHPNRLATILLLAMRQLEDFVAISRDPNEKWGNDNPLQHPVRKSTFSGSGATSGITEESPRRSAKRRPPVDFTAAINALRLIAGSLPYCFEDIDLLRAVVQSDEEEASKDELNVIITSQRTRELMGMDDRTESPLAAGFAHHFFVQGGKCFMNNEPGAHRCFYADLLDEEKPNPPTTPLGFRLVELLVKLFFVPKFSQMEPMKMAPSMMEELRGSLAYDLKLLSLTRALVPQNFGSTEDINEDDECWMFSFEGTYVKEARSLVLRAILLTISVPIFYTPSCLSDAQSREPQGNEGSCSHESSGVMYEEVSDVMLSGLFDVNERPLLVKFFVLLLHVVRCCPKWPVTVPSLRGMWAARPTLTADNVDVLSHSLAILAAGFYTGPYVASQRYVHRGEKPVRVPSVLYGIMHQVIGSNFVPWKILQGTGLEGIPASPVVADPYEVGSSGMGCSSATKEPHDCDGLPDYARSFADGVLALLEAPLIAGSSSIPKPEAPCSSLGLHLMLWLLQHSEAAINAVGRKPRLLLVLVQTIHVVGTQYPSYLGEGQIALLCFLRLLRHQPFLRLLLEHLPTDGDADLTREGKVNATQFLRELRVAMPTLPNKLVITSNMSPDKRRQIEWQSDEVLCIRTYCDVLVLTLCYVVAPGSPSWFSNLHRTAVEVLHTLQVYLPKATGRFPLDVLSEHIVFEVAGSFNHICSPRVLMTGADAQLACFNMIKAVSFMLEAAIAHINGGSGAALLKNQEHEDVECKGGESNIVALLWLLVTQGGLSELTKHIQTQLDSKTKAAAGGSSYAEPCSGKLGDGTGVGVLKELLHSDEFNFLRRVTNEVAQKLKDALEDSSGRGNGTEKTTEVDIEPCHEGERWMKSSGKRLWFERDDKLFQKVLEVGSSVVNEKEQERREKGRLGGEFVTSPVALREASVPFEGAAKRWLLRQLWVQVHRLNTGPPVFDFRTATIIRE